MTQFYDCSVESISINTMGIATVNYTIISDNDEPDIATNYAGLTGIIMSYNTQLIPNSQNSDNGGWYTTSVTLVATK